VEEGFKRVDYVVSDCHFTANYIEAEGFRQKGTTTVIWDCVDLEKFTSLKTKGEDLFYKNYNLPNPKEHPWILSLGRLSFTAAHKGYERLIEVFKKITEEEKKSVLVYAGKGNMVDHLKELATKFEVSDRVYFSGMVHEDDLPKFYRASRVFTLVSDRGKGRGEGIPLTPLEAMACGSPIIVGNQDGSQEAVFNETNGYCIDPFDLELHSRRALSLLQDDKLFKDKSLAAIDIANTYFSFREFVSKHQDFLTKL
jgi:phosphatidylinositol alpha-1,6-mannosyltransferase